MPNLFAGNIGTASDGLTRDLIQDKSEPGLNKGTGRQDVMRFNFAAGDITNGDTVRLGTIQSDARIVKCEVFAEANGGSGSVKVGFYKSGDNNDGVVVDAGTTFGTHSVASALQTDTFTSELSEHQRGDTAWELAGLSADPQETWDFVIELDVDGGGAFQGCLLISYATD
jgi:hypothetical protein